MRMSRVATCPRSLALDRGFAGVIAIGGTNLSTEADRHDGASAVGLSLERTIMSSADPPPHELALLVLRSRSDRDRSAALELDPERVGFAQSVSRDRPRHRHLHRGAVR